MSFNQGIAPVCFILFPAVLTAQTAAIGTITGTVLDPSGSAITQATITVHSADTGVDRIVTTTGAGIYVATFLNPGHYDLTAKKAGFATGEQKDVAVQVGRTLSVDFSLTIAPTGSTVTVSGQSELIDTGKTEMSQVVNSNPISNFPIVGAALGHLCSSHARVTTDGAMVSYHGISG